jgi:hypothetical protein
MRELNERLRAENAALLARAVHGNSSEEECSDDETDDDDE